MPSRRCSVVVALTVVALAGTACGGGGDTGGDYYRVTSAHPLPTPETAATGFVNYFAYDGTSCDEPFIALEGEVTDDIWDSYSCTRVMPAEQVRAGCDRIGVSATGVTGAHLATVGEHPLRKRVDISWSGTTKCPDGTTTHVDGTYRVTVAQISGGWVVSGAKVLTGPGAGLSVG